MRYLELREKFRGQELFSLEEIRLLSPGFYRARLNEWQRKGHIRKLIRTYYYFTDKEFDEPALFRAANRIYPPSYISLQSALAYYGLIPEKPLAVVSITSRKTKDFHTPLGRMAYRKVSEKIFGGYRLIGSGKDAFLMASPAKALLDLLYLEPGLRSKEGVEGLRINARLFREQATLGALAAMAKHFTDHRILETVREVVRK